MSRQNAPVSIFEANPVLAAVKVGAWTGTAGLLYGGVSGIFQSRHPGAHTISRGIHWFAFGTTYWWLRSNILKLHYEDAASSKQRANASALSGAIAGGGVTRLMGGRLIPGAIVFSLLSYAGQWSYNAIDAWQLERANAPSKPFLQQMAESKWIPLKSLSDDDYRVMLTEKSLSIETEMALIDDKIEELQKSKEEGQGGNQ